MVAEGDTFGWLTVRRLHSYGTHGRSRKWLCVCGCGGTKAIYEPNLTTGATTSCGCKLQRHRFTRKRMGSSNYLLDPDFDS